MTAGRWAEAPARFIAGNTPLLHLDAHVKFCALRQARGFRECGYGKEWLSHAAHAPRRRGAGSRVAGIIHGREFERRPKI